MKTKRAFSVTTGEMSSFFFFIAMMMFTIGAVQVIKISNLIAPVNPVLSGGLMFGVLICIGSIIFYFLSMIIPNSAITKNNLNILIDRITNPDFMGWMRYTRDHKFLLHTVEIGSDGRTKGMANDKKADVINNGDYTVTASNGNQLIVVNDFLSHNKNLGECVGWSLVKKHYGIIGYDTYRKAVANGETMSQSSKNDKNVDGGWQ